MHIRSEIKYTLRLATPIVLGQVGQMTMGIVDTLVAGRINTDVLAGLGLGSILFWHSMVILLGLLLALDTFFSQAFGAKNHIRLRVFLGQSLWLAGAVSLMSVLVILVANFAFRSAAEDTPANAAFSTYVLTASWSVPTICLFFVLQRYWQAKHVVVFFTVITILANVVNLLANLAFGLGQWGFPRLETQGIALATIFSRSFMFVAAAAFTAVKLGAHQWRFHRFDWRIQRRFLILGLPAGGQTALEVSVFSVTSFIIGFMGATPLAAHHICLTVASFTFMVALGVSSAAVVRVGNFIGAGEPSQARLSGWVAQGLAALSMALFSIVFIVAGTTIIGWFTHDEAVIRLGRTILIIVGVFQIADGLQVTATGALRGLGNTRLPMIANLIGHYPIGLLLGLILGFGFDLDAIGLWIGLAAGLISVAIMVVFGWKHEIDRWKGTKDEGRGARRV